MTANITIYPDVSHLSPYQRTRPQAPALTNDAFLNGFGDVLDIINPLQHVPILSSLYREVTGDQPSEGATLIGGTLFGGLTGFAASLANLLLAQETGQDLGGHLLSSLDLLGA